MLEKKLTFSREMLDTVREICKTVFNLQTDVDVVNMFGISESQMEKVIAQIVDSLPDKLFEEFTPSLQDEIKYISAREYIFFQVQEKWDDLHYQENLKNFIHVYSRDIQHRINSYLQKMTKEDK
jgi:pyrroloquinoline quinone (PQQ) biosynthesis protein C